ncbi:hypothetical protein QMK28_25400 [Streptomyces sp. H27-D2]|nr:hypothetical protein [Streptomyces sp. H27-D2]MEC4019544.1 hypothetical protein [Streptomyces sp. H27-D2]
MARRPVALVAGIVLILEAIGIALINWFLGLAVDRQQMSLADLDPDAMAVGSWVAGGVFGLYLLFCGVVLLRCGLRDRAPGRFSRIVLITCAVVHGLLGAFTVGLVGWTAFIFMMLVLALIVLSLVVYEPVHEPRVEDARRDGGGGAPEPPGAGPDKGANGGPVTA